VKLYLASTDLADLAPVAARGLLDGVFLSPPMLIAAATGRTADEVLLELARGVRRPVVTPIASVFGDDLLLEARARAKAADGIVVQVPFIEDALRPMHDLVADGVRVAATLVVTAPQALLAAKVGASSVIVDVDLLEQHGLDASSTLSAMRTLLDRHAMACDLIALHPRGSGPFAACLSAGADGVIIEPSALRDLLTHPLTDRGLDRLLSAMSRRPRVLP
jgi:transaldolase